jgi:hypothetical protein
MAVPSSPSVGSRAQYFSYAVPGPAFPANPAGGPTASGPNPNFGFSPVPSSIPPDCGPAGVALPAIVLSLGGTSPDFAGMVLAVHAPNGQIVLRSAGFTSGQPLLNQATWTSNGSNAAQARWVLMDATA